MAAVAKTSFTIDMDLASRKDGPGENNSPKYQLGNESAITLFINVFAELSGSHPVTRL